MRKPLAAALVLLFSSVLVHAAELTIPAGQTYTVSPAQSDLRLDRLSIGDNAQIKFADGVSRWRVDAKRVTVGSNVVIDGRGTAGAIGANGLTSGNPVKDCEDGAPGRAGAAGESGGNGVALVFWWGIDSFGSVKVLADGGAGGNGGQGAQGQNAGRVNHCSGSNGGNGGAGGAAGNGGKGGAISLNYFDASGKGAPSLQDRLSISTIGGRPGAAGTGGTGGTGSEGRFQRVNTSDRWFPNGDAGATGATGAGGVAGTAGGVDIQAVAANSSPNWAGEVTSNAAADRGTLISLQQQVQALKETRAPATPEAAGLEQQVQALQEQVKSLEQRVKALEKR